VRAIRALRRARPPRPREGLGAGAADAAVGEVSTAGLRKPVGELYPARDFLEMVADAGNPVALSSDAHGPEHLGYGYAEALELLADVGITQLTTFDRRTPRQVPIADADREAAHRHGDAPPVAIDPETGRPGS
jgi:histidinol-phosphatase (PHP family)